MPSIGERPSPNHGPRPDGAVVDMLVLHYTGMPSAGAALDWLCNADAEVSAHYLIDEDGTTTAMVPEDRRAWHAGAGSWRGATDVNDRSVGIELVNPGHDFGYRAFPDPQIAALIELCQGILARHPIPARNVVGHSDVAPARKIDPGELFPWPWLAAEGIGLWPDADAGASDVDIADGLAAYGYDIDGVPLATVVGAFQRHFRPARIDGAADAETTARLAALLAKIAAVAPFGPAA